MEVPHLDIRYPGPGDPTFGTPSHYYDLEALKTYASKITTFLEDLNSSVAQLEAKVQMLEDDGRPPPAPGSE